MNAPIRWVSSIRLDLLPSRQSNALGLQPEGAKRIGEDSVAKRTPKKSEGNRARAIPPNGRRNESAGTASEPWDKLKAADLAHDLVLRDLENKLDPKDDLVAIANRILLLAGRGSALARPGSVVALGFEVVSWATNTIRKVHHGMASTTYKGESRKRLCEAISVMSGTAGVEARIGFVNRLLVDTAEGCARDPDYPAADADPDSNEEIGNDVLAFVRERLVQQGWREEQVKLAPIRQALEVLRAPQAANGRPPRPKKGQPKPTTAKERAAAVAEVIKALGEVVPERLDRLIRERESERKATLEAIMRPKQTP